MKKNSPDVVVIGAGIAGLAAAFRLSRAGLNVTVLEAADQVGGKMLSTERDGFVLNQASTIIPGAYSALFRLAKDAGLGDVFTPTATSFGVMREGSVRALRGGGLGAALDAVRTDLLSTRSKLRLRHLAVDALRWHRELPADDFEAAARLDTETVAEYSRRRLNGELYDYLVDPLMRGIYVAEPSGMSIVDFALTLGKFAAGGLMQYPNGIDFLAKRLATGLDVRLGATVERVEHFGDGVEVRLRQDGREQQLKAAGAVIAVPAPDLVSIHANLAPRQRELVESIEYVQILRGVFALRSLPAGTPTVIVVPSNAGLELGIALVDTHSMPNSAPAGKAVMSGHWVDRYARASKGRSDEDLLAEMIPEMEAVVPGFERSLEFALVKRWEAATIANRQGLYGVMAELRRSLPADDVIQLAGGYFTVQSTNSSALSGEHAAARLIHRLQRAEGSKTRSGQPRASLVGAHVAANLGVVEDERQK